MLNKEQIYKLLKDKNEANKLGERKYGEVFTPLNVVENTLNLLPVDIWLDSSQTWFEPAVGIGNFIVPVYFRLMDSLSVVIPNSNKRHHHIINKMLYMSEINAKNANICRRIFGKNANIYIGDTMQLDTYKQWGLIEFGVVFGNPPYQEINGNRGSTKPMYNQFMERFIDSCKVMLFITPSRWFGAGKGLSTFRKSMLSRMDIRLINHCENSTIIFPRYPKIMGGISIIYKDSSYYGYCSFNSYICNINKYDIIVEPKYQSIVDKVLMKMDYSIGDICMGQNYSGIRSNDNRLSNVYSVGSRICYVSERNNDNHIFKYVKHEDLLIKDYSKWKVMTVEANGYWNYFGRSFIAGPEDVCNQSFIVFEVDTFKESVSLLSYLNTKIINFMMGIRKFSQHISPETCKWIPLLPFDHVFTDSYLYDFFNLDYHEIAIIEELYSKILIKKMIKDLDFLGRIVNQYLKNYE